MQRDTVVVTVTGGAFDVGEPGEPLATEPDSEFEQIYRAEYARLVAIARTYLPGREAAHDAVQEAFVRLFRNWTEVRHHDVPGAWVRRVLVNLCIDINRRSKREAAANQRVETMPRPDGPAVDLGSDARPDADLLRRATAELPDLQRAVVALHYVDELSVAEIAEVLDVHVGTVKTSLFRARRRLAKIMEEQS